MDLQLRDECRNLLTQLRVSQKSIRDKLHSSKEQDIPSHNYNECHNDEVYNFGKDITGRVNISKDANTNLKPTYARNKLLSLSKSSTNASNEVLDMNMNTTYLRDKENHNAFHTIGNSAFDQTPKHELLRDVSMDLRDHHLASTTAVSPTRLKKRQLIDKHTSVETKLNQKELKELQDERFLNFNYCNINVDQSDGIKSLTNVEKNIDEQSKEKNTKHPELAIHSSPTVTFSDQLQDEGNDRRFKDWVKEASVEPKSLLNSTNYYNLSKRGINSRVKFNSSVSDEVPMGDPRLLGYDWIAALLDNERNMVDQSESFFDEICDFRKAFKNECNNQFYNESPYTLVDREPEPVVEALTDPKVRPFVVNERLFTEPLTSDLIEDDYDKSGKRTTRKEPTKENPRFVRVSIPRSTLQTPHRVKPHRRGSFDGSDSCSLVDHCLLGWENTVPSMMPPAKSLSLAADAGTEINSQTTTLAEAERLATVQNQVQWHLSRPSSQSQILPRWRKHYMDTTLNLTVPPSAQQYSNANSSTTLNQTSACGGRATDVKRTTDRILQATYSTMYEMERLRQQRGLENLEKL